MIREQLSGGGGRSAAHARWRSALGLLLVWSILAAVSILLPAWLPILARDFPAFAGASGVSGVLTLVSGAAVWLVALGLSFLWLRDHWTVLECRTEMAAMARTDPLTGVSNRLFFEEMFHRETLRAEREGHELSLLLVAIDRLRILNERQGRQAGDRALQSVAVTLQATLRESDWIGRLAGDEFLVLAKGGPDAAQVLGERLREAIARALPGGAGVPDGGLTVSIGHSSSGLGEARRTALPALLADAEIACHAAKESGRDQVLGFSSQG